MSVHFWYSSKTQSQLGKPIGDVHFWHYITYRYAGNGIIAYDYYKITDWDTVKSYASAAGMTVLSVLAFLLSQGAVQLQPTW